MNDLISRQVAIDKLETVGYDFSNSGLSEIELEEVCEAVGDVRQDMISMIKRLPSAEPEKRTENTQKTHACDCISRQAAIDAMSEAYEKDEIWEEYKKQLIELPSVQTDSKELSSTHKALDTISRQAVLNALSRGSGCGASCHRAIKALPSAQPEQCKFEYHYDHTDCIWYRPGAQNRCPVTCAQYRDGWNDAMNYIFRDGKGYRPYRRDKQYGE